MDFRHPYRQSHQPFYATLWANDRHFGKSGHLPRVRRHRRHTGYQSTGAEDQTQPHRGVLILTAYRQPVEKTR